jgi:hypothetical protein
LSPDRDFLTGRAGATSALRALCWFELEKIQEHAAIDRDRLARDLKEMEQWPVSEV